MVSSGSRGTAALLLASVLLGSLMAFADPGDGPVPAAARAAADAARRVPLSTIARRRAPLAGFDPLRHERVGDRQVASLAGGRKAELSLDPGLQSRVAAYLRRYAVPYAAAVAIEPSTGRVLAYVSHSSADSGAGDLVRDASAPAASVFKLVTASALIDAGVSPDARVCYGGGSHRLTAQDLADDARRDRSCTTLQSALGQSTNSVFAKLSDRRLDAATLGRYAEAFGFGHALPFDVPTQPSARDVPADRLERARTAAGFWHMHLSPLHGALLAATFARGGSMPVPTLIERVIERDGRVAYERESRVFRDVISRATARTVGRMMQRTVSEGTSRRAFHDGAGRPRIPGVAVAGKTGSLSRENPYRAYSWWVGYAPAEHPTIAFATLVANQPLWHIKANQVAVEALRYWFVERPEQRVAPADQVAPAPFVVAEREAVAAIDAPSRVPADSEDGPSATGVVDAPAEATEPGSQVRAPSDPAGAPVPERAVAEEPTDQPPAP